MARFEFITNEQLRDTLDADLLELSACVEAQAWKAVHVLAGSIVETLLVDHIVSEGIMAADDASKLTLGGALKLSTDKQVISRKTADLCSVIKEYRNLIHPGRLIRTKERATASSAKVAQSLIDIVLDEVAAQKKQNYGYTAEQIVSKLENDSSAEAIMIHLLKETKPIEIERLLLRVLPEAYSKHDDPFAPDHLLGGLERCFRTAFEYAPDDLKKRVAAKFVTIVKEESDSVVFGFATAFFRSSDLAYINVGDRAIVKDHFLSRLQKAPSFPILTALTGIGRFLEDQDIARFIDPLVKIIALAIPKWTLAEHGR